MNSKIALILTNGESGARAVRSILPDVMILSWNDVLHEGPVPNDEQLEAVTSVRARYLQDTLGKDRNGRDVLAELRDRDRIFEEALRFAASGLETVLWFESDLYDQLQVAQIVSAATIQGGRLHVVPWAGSLLAGDDRLERAFESRRPLRVDEMTCARALWHAVASDTPEALQSFVERPDAPIPAMRMAALRLLEEYPGVVDGVSRTQRQAATILLEGACEPDTLFRRCVEREEDPFMGDWSFFRAIDRLADGVDPMVIKSREDTRSLIELTEFGRAVASGSEDFLSRNRIDHWIGGVRLVGPPVWRWDRAKRRLRSPQSDY